jgi:hypothetical protein
LVGLEFLLAPADNALHGVVERFGQPGQANADIGEETGTLGGDRGADLRGSRDAFHQHLRFLAG